MTESQLLANRTKDYYCPKFTHDEHPGFSVCPRCLNCKHDWVVTATFRYGRRRRDQKLCLKCGAGFILRNIKFKEQYVIRDFRTRYPQSPPPPKET